MSFNELSDEECVLLAQVGNRDALDFLCLKYQRYAYGLAIDFFNTNRYSGIPVDDLFSVAEATILVAVKRFSMNIHLFYPYWKTIATNALIKFNRKNSYFHEAKMFYGISLDQQNDDYFSNDQVLGEPDMRLQKSLVEDTFLNIIENPANDFLESEKLAMKLTLEGYAPLEIMKMLKWSKAQVYYALKKAKEKLADVITKKYR